MMRHRGTPHEGCGTSRARGARFNRGNLVRALTRVLSTVAVALSLLGISSVTGLLPGTSAFAQDPSVTTSSSGQKSSSFPEPPGGMFGKIKTKLDSTKPMNLQGDQLVYDTTGSKVIARGNVEIYYNDYILTADEVVYDQSAGTLTAVGNVTLKEPQGNVIRADRYTLTDDFRDGFVQSLSITASDDSRITADRATRREGNITEFENGKFTPCKSDGGSPPLWCISAARIIHDKGAATVTYQDATFDVFGQPIFYMPYFQHPDPSVKRKSGFLAPQIGNSSNLGYMTEIPYYFALDPSYDLLFHPLYMTKQGVLWQADWRQRLSNGEYVVKVAGIDQDANDLPGTLANRQDRDGWRGSLETRGLFSLSSWWKFGWDVTIESDDDFRRFYKLDSILVTDRVNLVYLTGQSDRNYFSARMYQFGGLLLTDTDQAASYTHPIIDYNYVFEDPVFGGELKWDTNVLSFSRDDGVHTTVNGTKNQNINRFVSELKWRRRFTDQVGITYTPFGNLRADVYQFNNFTDPESVEVDAAGNVIPASRVAVNDDTTLRGNAEGGITVAYPWIAHSETASHIIEPIGQIISRQNAVTQRTLPNEDARSLVFDDTNLFETSKFSGYDRIETGTRVNAGVQYTFQANDGGYARFLAGQSYHLSGDNIYTNPGRNDDGTFVYNPSSGLETDKSDYVLGAYIAPNENFRLISQSRFDQDSMALRREDLAAVVMYGPLAAQAIYSYSAADPLVGIDKDQQDIVAIASLQLTENWSASAGVRYDIDAGALRQDTFQVKYSDECFVLTAAYIEQHYDTATITDDRTVMLRFELKHLGEFAYKTDNLDFMFGGDQRTN